MIQFHRTSNMTLLLDFDIAGLNNLAETFQSALMTGQATIQMMLNRSVINLKRSAQTLVTDVIIRLEGNEEVFAQTENGFVWLFSQEMLENAVWYFQEAVRLGNCYPAEFLYVKIPKNKKHKDFIFCEMLSET